MHSFYAGIFSSCIFVCILDSADSIFISSMSRVMTYSNNWNQSMPNINKPPLKCVTIQWHLYSYWRFQKKLKKLLIKYTENVLRNSSRCLTLKHAFCYPHCRLPSISAGIMLPLHCHGVWVYCVPLLPTLQCNVTRHRMNTYSTVHQSSCSHVSCYLMNLTWPEHAVTLNISQCVYIGCISANFLTSFYRVE